MSLWNINWICMIILMRNIVSCLRLDNNEDDLPRLNIMSMINPENHEYSYIKNDYYFVILRNCRISEYFFKTSLNYTIVTETIYNKETHRSEIVTSTGFTTPPIVTYNTLNKVIKIPTNVKKFKIEMKQCSEPDDIRLIFYWNNTEIIFKRNPDFQLINDVFTANNLVKSPIVLKVIYKYEPPIAVITFNLTKNPIINPCKNQKLCFGSCENRQSKRGYICTILINNHIVEAGYLDESCDKEKSQGNCQDYEKKNMTLCNDVCLDKENCNGYVCAVKNPETKDWTETGYVGHVNEWYRGNKIGVNQNKWDGLPVELVDFNECLVNVSNLCQTNTEVGMISHCIDRKLGFICSNNGQLNWHVCLEMKNRYPYWQCYNQTTNVSLIDSAIDQLRKFSQSKNNRDDELLSSIGNWLMNTRLEEITKSNQSEQLSMVLLETISTALLNSPIQEQPVKINDKITGQKMLLKSNQDSLQLPLFKLNSPYTPPFIDENPEFIKLNLPNNNSLSGPIVVSYAYYKDFDLLNERNITGQMLQRARTNLQMFRSVQNLRKLNGSAGPDEVQYFRNSDMFSVQLNKQVDVSVQYLIRPFYSTEKEQISWMYKLESVCGFLDLKKGWVWSKRGCRKVLRVPQGVSKQWYCECSHLTNFAMLFSLHQMNQWHFHVTQYLSVIGAIVQCCSLLLFVIFALWINSRDKLRLDLFNVALCLLSSTLVFSIGGLIAGSTSSELSEGQDSGGGTSQLGCSLVALVTQYLLLAAFIWKLMLGINVVRMVSSIRYQEDWLVKYRILLIGVCYSVPMLIIALAAALDFKSYGMIASNVCWIYPGSRAYLSFVVPVGIVVAVNILVLIFIAQVLIKNYLDTHKTKINGSNELLVFVQLSVSMGLTWLPCYFATMYLWAQYMFVIGFPCQGLLMFLLVVVINKENREKVSSFLASFTSRSTSSTDSKLKSSMRNRSTKQTDSLLSRNNEFNPTSNDSDPNQTLNSTNQKKIISENC